MLKLKMSIVGEKFGVCNIDLFVMYEFGYLYIGKLHNNNLNKSRP